MTGTGSKLNLLALTAIAAVLGLAVGLDPGGGGTAPPPDTRLVPDARSRPISRLVLERPDGGEGFELVREADGGYAMALPVPAPVEPAAVADLIGTLELLAWRRKVDAPPGSAGLDRPRFTIRLAFGGDVNHGLAIGQPVTATDQVWVQRIQYSAHPERSAAEGRAESRGAYLIDGAAARALDRRAADLRQRRPLALRVGDVVGVEISAGDRQLVLGGRPLAVHPAGSSGTVRADVAAARALIEILSALQLRRFVDGAHPPAPGGLRIRVIGVAGAAELTDVGPCPGHDRERLVVTSAGTGCVADVDLATIIFGAAQEAAFYDRHLLAVDVDRPRAITIGGERAGAITLTGRGGGWVSGGVELDGEAVRAWGTAFDDLPAGDPVASAGLGPLTERGRIVLDYGSGRIDTVVLVADRRGELYVGRAGEPVVWPAGPAGPAVFAPVLHPFLGRVRWQEHPSSLRTASRTVVGSIAERIERGLDPARPLEDWTAATPAGATVVRAAAEALAEAGSRLVAADVVAERRAPAHGLQPPRAVIDLTFADPAGGTATFGHRITIGAATADGGCFATGDDQPAVLRLDAATCSALLGPWIAT